MEPCLDGVANWRVLRHPGCINYQCGHQSAGNFIVAAISTTMYLCGISRSVMRDPSISDAFEVMVHRARDCFLSDVSSGTIIEQHAPSQGVYATHQLASSTPQQWLEQLATLFKTVRAACADLREAQQLHALLLVGPSMRNPHHAVLIALELTSSTTAPTALSRDLTSLAAQAGAVGTTGDKLWVLLRLPDVEGGAPLTSRVVLRPAQCSLLLLAPCMGGLTVSVRTRGNGQTVAEVVLRGEESWSTLGRLQRER